MVKLARERHTMAPSTGENTTKNGQIYAFVNRSFKQLVHDGYNVGALLMQNIKWGIIIHLQHIVMHDDKEILCESTGNLACIYANYFYILIGFETNEHHKDAVCL